MEGVIHWQARGQKELQPERFGEQLRQRLKDYPDCKQMRTFELEGKFEANRSPSQTQRENWTGFRFTSANKLYVAQFTRDGLVFSRLEPYENWETFAAEAQRLWKIFVELAEPAEVQRLGVRFINRIMPINFEDLGKLLQRPPKRLESLGFPISGFLYQSTHDVPGYPYRINVIDTIQPPLPSQNGGPGLILDIDAFTTRTMENQEGVLNLCLAELHWLKNKAFFSLLKPSAIKRFEKER